MAWLPAQIQPSENVYISFDAIPWTRHSSRHWHARAGWFNFREIDDLLMGIPGKGKLTGLDIMEVNPLRDASGRTAQTAMRLLVDTLGAAFP